MGMSELRERWGRGGAWDEKVADWRVQREADLPELRTFVHFVARKPQLSKLGVCSEGRYRSDLGAPCQRNVSNSFRA
jgi:hypothetical protein